jgi:hypothetical protein
MAGQNFEQHGHQAMLHRHEHAHITHHCQGGLGGPVEHLVAAHDHEHNHPALGHAHQPHENFEREHGHEGHIHDHAHPEQS